jgi:anti-sigma B factor antagonist
VASRKGGQLKLLNVQKRLQDLLEMTRLTGVFETFDSEDQAVESYGGSVSAVS